MATTPKQFARDIKKMRRDMDKIVLPPIRKSSKRLSSATRKGVKKTPLGRRIFRRGGSIGTPGIKVIRARFSRTEGGFVGGVRIFGMARNIVTGDPTRPHVITARRAPFLVFNTAGGIRKAKTVRHPGGHIDKHPVQEREFRKESPKFSKAVTRALEQFYRLQVAR